MTRTPRPISARVRILGAILAVACVGLAIVGSVTFLVQRERVLDEVDDRLAAQVESLQTVADDADDGARPSRRRRGDRGPRQRRLHLGRGVPQRGRRAARAGAQRGVGGDHRRCSRAAVPRRCRASTSPTNQELIERVVDETADGSTISGHRGDRPGVAALHRDPGRAWRATTGQGLYVRAVDLGAELAAGDRRDDDLRHRRDRRAGRDRHRRLVRHRAAALADPPPARDRRLHHDHRPLAAAAEPRATTTSPTCRAP